MNTAAIQPDLLACPRCLRAPLRAGGRFCPQCGMTDVLSAAADRTPLDVPVGPRVFRILERVAAGSVANVYRCRFFQGPAEVEAIVKIARDARVNDLLLNECETLRRLHAADRANRYTPFLPYVEASFRLDSASGAPARQANVLRVHPAIRAPADELFTLDQVREKYPRGLDSRHVAWIWRRVLSVLGFAHATGVVHGAVLPPHLLIEPREHKLVLVNWCCAVAAHGGKSVRAISGTHMAWYKRESASRAAAAPAIDIALAARSMIQLLGGDPVLGMVPPGVDPALQRYFSRCIRFGPAARPQAASLLSDFDRLIEALWGPRRFVPLEM